MAVRIRMTRTGANRDISFRVVATDSRSPRDGQYIELLGWYDPKRSGENCKLKLDRIEYWRKKGAGISATVASLLRRVQRQAAAAAPAAAPAPAAPAEAATSAAQA